MDCIYLTREQIEALYKLTFKSKRSVYGEPINGVQIRGTADASEAVEFDACTTKFSGIAGAYVEADGKHHGWTA